MWRNYMTVGIRALVKNKTYAFINIFGLGVGLAACLMLLLYVRYETTYDQWLPNAENTYQFQTHYQDKQTGRIGDLQMASYVTESRLRNDFPQIDPVRTQFQSAGVDAGHRQKISDHFVEPFGFGLDLPEQPSLGIGIESVAEIKQTCCRSQY